MNLLEGENREFLNIISEIPQGEANSERSLLANVVNKDVSIIVPCYNSEKYLKECLYSIIKQKTICDYEIIAINDGSVDKTREILEEISKAYPIVRVISTKNNGISEARNRGIMESHGKYLIFVDSDDYVSSNYIEMLFRCIVKEKADICACSYFSFYKSRKYKTIKAESNFDKRLLNGCVWGKIFKRGLFKNIMFPRDYWYEDSILSYLIYPRVTKFFTTNTCYYAYRKNKSGITQSSKFYVKALDTIYITDLMLTTATNLYGEEYILSKGYELIIDQFFLNHLRLLNLPIDIQKYIFNIHVRFLNKYFPFNQINRFDRKSFEKAIRAGNFKKTVKVVKYDRLYKLLNRFLNKFL